LVDGTVGIDIFGFKHVLSSTQTLIRLKQTSSQAETLSLHDTRDNTNYQVPAANKATVIGFVIWTAGAAGDKLIFADNADGTTNGVDMFAPNSADDFTDEIFISAEVPADKFINLTQTAANTMIVELWIIEEPV